MPLPAPNKGESESDFVGRCMGTQVMKDDYSDEKQRLAVCYSQFQRHKEKKSEGKEFEVRTFDLAIDDIEERGEAKQRTLVGHASVFNTPADILYWREKVEPGAFLNSIKSDDIRALFNHDPNFVLGRNKSGTLKLSEDEKGLAVEITPPDTQFGKDMIRLIERGDVSQMSIGFRVVKDEWKKASDDKELDERTIKEAKLRDVSPVTFPAFETTDVSLRSYQEWKKETDRKDRDALKFWRYKLELERRT